ncbi:MAG: hypothetical protein KGI97_00825 [Alphaproteobacteria bacterium]|nr:hypothetical protein [Alphaproteobacteria bacterium]
MADIFYLNKQTRDNMRLARQCILKTYDLVRQGREKTALRFANRAVEAFDLAMRKSREPEQDFLFIPPVVRPGSTGDAA